MKENVNKKINTIEALHLSTPSNSFAIGYSSNANGSNYSSATGYSSAFTNANQQPINQHFVDSALEGTIYGFSEVKRLAIRYYTMPNGEIVSVPFETIDYAFYIKSPVDFKKNCYFKITPMVREQLDFSNKENKIGYTGALSINCIDSENDIPSDEEFTYSAINDNLSFKITNARNSLNDDTYRFSINGIEFLSLFDDRFNGFLEFNLDLILHFFDKHDYFEDKYKSEIQKHINKIKKKYNIDISDSLLIKNSICSESWSDNGKEYLNVCVYKNYKPTNIFHNVVFKSNGNDGHSIFVNENNRVQNNSLKNKYKNLQVILTNGEGFKDKTFYKILIVGGEIVAYDKM